MGKSEEFDNSINKLGETSSTAEGTPSSQSEPQDHGAVEELQQSLAAKTEEAQEVQNKYLRLAAEFENYKKLALRDQREHVRFGNEKLLKELLPVIDNLERAIKSGKENQGGEGLLQGVELTLKHALEVLEKFGVHPIQSVGQPFDPASQQAVVQVEHDSIKENCIIEEYQKGYVLHDRVLRAAMVSVSKGASSQDSPSPLDEGNENTPEK